MCIAEKCVNSQEKKEFLNPTKGGKPDLTAISLWIYNYQTWIFHNFMKTGEESMRIWLPKITQRTLSNVR